MIETTFIETNHVKLHVALAGPKDGEPVILLHGFPDFWFCWEKQMKALADQGFRVIVPDQRGFNLSDKPKGIKAYSQEKLATDIIDLAKVLGYDQFNLAGHDFGGLVSWSLASLHPEYVKKMVILSAPHLGASAKYNKSHVSQKLKSWYVLFFQLKLLPESFLRAFDYRILVKNMPASLSAEEIARYKKAWSQPNGIKSMINWYRAFLEDINSKAIRHAQIEIPTHIIWGDQDKYLETGLAELSLDQCSNGKLTIFEDTSHWLMNDEADAVSQILIKHFK
jgi:pimeloyl-ACP methyl ester carboxylesterase